MSADTVPARVRRRRRRWLVVTLGGCCVLAGTVFWLCGVGFAWLLHLARLSSPF